MCNPFLIINVFLWFYKDEGPILIKAFRKVYYFGTEVRCRNLLLLIVCCHQLF
jgi:hypothetical protein